MKRILPALCQYRPVLPYHQMKIYKRFAATIDYKNMSAVDVEKELFKMKRDIGVHYSNGSFGKAVALAREMEENVVAILGPENAVRASCLNNIALMEKFLGNHESAMQHYNRALAIYEKTEGKNHPSYLSTLSNIAALNKYIADSVEGAEKEKYLIQSEEALRHVIERRKSSNGGGGKELLIAMNHLGGVMKSLDRRKEALELYRDTLSLARSRENMEVMRALTLNNMGLLLKQDGEYSEALACYEEALAIRMEVGGEKHHETLLVLHNISELHITQGNNDKANEYKQQIMQVMQKRKEAGSEQQAWSDNNVFSSLPSHLKGKIPDEDEDDSDSEEKRGPPKVNNRRIQE